MQGRTVDSAYPV